MKALLIPVSLLVAAFAANAHVSLDPARAEAGTFYRGILRVAHGCDGAPTTSVDVVLPPGTQRARASAKSGWQLVETTHEIVWTAARGQALAAHDKGEFPLEFQLPATPGPLWLKVLQRCQGGSMNWVDVPAQGTSTEGMKTPAVLLQVLSHDEFAAAQSQPVVDGAWARASVPGQQVSGAYMRITAKEPTQLVAVSTPVAGKAEVHEMKMDGEVMRMRPAGPVELPVGRAFELKPGGFHVMLQDLKKPLEPGSSVPLTLVFRNARGVESRMDLRVPVSAQPPQGSAAAADHKH
jgi:periplasmic copper chaperone A